jgi:nicotinamide-nucleotide amidase
MVTDAAGASDYFVGGFVVYSREAKEDLGVPASVMDEHGTVSEETSRALAQAVRRRTGANAAIATTGFAGPTGPGDRPLGTLHLAVDLDGEVSVQTTRYTTTRSEFKRRGSTEALFMLWQALRKREQAAAPASV